MTKRQLLRLTCATGALIVASPAFAGQGAGAPASVNPEGRATVPAADGQATTADQDQKKAPQTTDPDEQKPEKGKARVEERDIVITGSKFQKLLDQPQSKSVINAEDRNLAGIGNIRTLISVQPGFNYSDAFGLNVRGVGRQTAQTLLGQENTVIQYVDGFINLVPSNIAESTLFGGNVQFIRGPSGTMGGRNSLAGSANLLSRAPTPEFTAEIEAGFGRNNYTDIGANIAGPITSNLGFRIGMQEFTVPTTQINLGTAKGAGFAQKNLYLEFQLEWRIGGFHIRNRATRFEYDNQPGYSTIGRYNNNLANGNPAAVFGGLAPNPQYGYAGPTPSNPYEINVDYAGYDRLRNNFQDILNADLDVGFAKLVYVGGYQQYRSTGSADLDGTSRSSYDAGTVAPGVFAAGTQVPTDYRSNYDNNNHFWSQEARLESKPGGPLNWVTGIYYFNQAFNEHYWENIANAGDVLATGGGGGTIPVPNPLKATFEQRNIYNIRSTAVFGNVTYDLTPNFRFDGGLRYTWDEKEATTNFRYIFYYPPFYASDVSPAVHSATPSRNDRGLSGRASLAWRPGGSDQLYISYQRGYQSSAFTLGQGLPPNNIANKEYLDVYEVGGNVTSGKLRFDGSIFYQNFFGQQIPIATRGQITTPAGPALGPVYSTITNAALSRIYGAELQLSWKPTPQANIVASYTYLHPTFKSFCPAVSGSTTQCGVVDITEPALINGVANPLYNALQNLSGSEIPRTPRNKATLYGYYGIDLGSAGHLYPGGSVSYQSSFYTSPFERARFRIPGRTVVGATLTYRSPGEHLDITATVNNLFRKNYADNLTVTSFANNTTNTVTSYGADRNWTVTARYRF